MYIISWLQKKFFLMAESQVLKEILPSCISQQVLGAGLGAAPCNIAHQGGRSVQESEAVELLRLYSGENL